MRDDAGDAAVEWDAGKVKELLRGRCEREGRDFEGVLLDF